MLHEIGATRVTFLPDLPTKVESASPHPLPGYVLATGIEANGRIVAQVHAGEPDPGLVDGGHVFVDDALLDRSVNAALVRAGLAYGEFCTSMPFPLIGHLRDPSRRPAPPAPASGGRRASASGPRRGRRASTTCPTW